MARLGDILSPREYTAGFCLSFHFLYLAVLCGPQQTIRPARPAIAMSAAIGFALAVGLIWWERSTGFSIKDLGPIAIGFAIIVLVFVMYQAIRQMGRSWAGAAIALGVSILIARLLELNVPVDPEIIQIITMVALIVGILALVFYTQGHSVYSQRAPVRLSEVRHDMTDLYRGRQLSNRLTKAMRKLRRQVDSGYLRLAIQRTTIT